MAISRRKFIKRGAVGGLAAAGAAVGGVNLLDQVSTDPKTAEAARPQAQGGQQARQWTMAIDLRKCEGCVTIGKAPLCAEACTTMHFVPDGQKWIEIIEEELPGGGSYFMPLPCQMCENAPCVSVCPVGASFYTEEGMVLVNQDICIGCRFCMAACPYNRRFFNWKEPELPAAAYFAEYSPDYPVPARRGTVVKCIFCLHNLRQGKLPACVAACAMNALYMGDLTEDIATNGVEVVQLSRFLSENGASRFKEDLGTRPRVYYIPGHGQDSGRDAFDEREMVPVPSWKERGDVGTGMPGMPGMP